MNDIEIIIQAILNNFDISRELLLSKRRNKELVIPRHIAIFLIRKKLQYSFPKIGRFFNMDHTTALHAYRKITKLIANNDLYIIDNLEVIAQEINYPLEPKEKYFNSNFNSNKTVQITQNKGKVKINVNRFENVTNENKRRLEEIYFKWINGIPSAQLMEQYKISRQRVYQLVNDSIEYKYKNMISPENDYYTFCKNVENIREKFILDKKEYQKKINKKEPYKKYEWSVNYPKCKLCGTTIKKHRSNGYCIICYPKSKLFKEINRKSRKKNIKKINKSQKEYAKNYYKRPEVIKKSKLKYDFKYYAGNRSIALKRDKYICTQCGISQSESLSKYKKDLFVEHIDGDNKNNDLQNLTSVCKNCHSKKIFKKLVKKNKSKKKENIFIILNTIKNYNKECNKGISIKTLSLLVGDKFNNDTVERHLNYLLQNKYVKNNYGTYYGTNKEF